MYKAGTVAINKVIELLHKYPDQIKQVREINTFEGTIVIYIGTPTETKEVIYIDDKGIKSYES